MSERVVLDGWDLAESLALGEVAPAPKDKPVKKKLNRQERIDLHLSLNEAIKRKARDEVAAFFEQGAEVIIPNSRAAVDTVENALIYFDRDVFEMVLSHGGVVSESHLYRLGQEGGGAGLEHLLDHFGRWPIALVDQKKLMDENDLGDPQQISPEMVFSKVHRFLYYPTHRQTCSKRMEGARAIEKRLPDLLTMQVDEAEKNGTYEWLARAAFNLFEQGEANQMSRFFQVRENPEFWKNVFEKFFSELTLYKDYAMPGFSSSQIKNLHRALSSYPFVKTGWDLASASMEKKHKQCFGFFIHDFDEFIAWGKQQSPQFSNLWKNFEQWLSKDLERNARLGWRGSLFGQALLSNPNLLEHFERMFNDPHSQKNFFPSNKTSPWTKNSLGKLTWRSFNAILLAQGSDCAILMAKTSGGQQAILREFENFYVARGFAQNANLTVFAQTLKAMPDLVAWRDRDGNSLIHYRLLTQEASKTLIDGLCAIDLDWINSPNAVGKTPRDFLKDPAVGKANPVLLAHLDRVLMNKTIRQDDEVVSKIRSRKPEGKRRM